MTPVPPGHIQCGVCEAIQPPATVCAVCGLALKLPPGVRPVADPPIVPLEGLEQTRFDEAFTFGDDVLPGLDPTSFEPVPEVRAPGVPGFEPTAELDVLDLPGDETDLLPGLEPTGDTFDRTPGLTGELPPGCPWCGFDRPTGRICDHCGRSRTRVLPRPARAATRPAADEDGRVRCRACGAIVAQGELCSDCGSPLPLPER